MEQLIIGGVISFLVTFYGIPVVIQVASEKKLFDVPDARKVHKAPIPSLGGLAMFSGFLIALLLTVNIAGNTSFQYYVASFLIIFLLGMKDDIIIITPIKKFVGQAIVAGLLATKGSLLITSMHGFLGINHLDPTASYFLTFFTVIGVINAFNLIDGIDGLAGSLGLITSAVFGTYFFINGDLTHALLGFTFAGALAAFLIYNFNPAKIFMGDTGSMLLGLVNVILVIRFIEMGPVFTAHPVSASPAIGFGILLLPIMDTLRVFGIRILHRRSPFSPDKNHLHHILLEKGMSHKAISLSIAGASILPITFCFLFQSLGNTAIVTGLIAFFFAGIYLLKSVKVRTQQLHVVKDEDEEWNDLAMQEEHLAASSVKLVPFYQKKGAKKAVAAGEDEP
ncbi:MraY family glycosyltransferase [Filimonas effusa]|uniref:Undecaprenyl/decaprenyl-phosphate alpha-N-acetylglucosaminyl 1-phosphate transferase n=1 Tax=Filimonas effusa TaxID=2508721 RepID=A0A4Q1D246_9BACT|nr:MraY family glycosyltransferase [Filimonas effusa]RXK81854.1 undecaprenyl/decaprenyl-phosphate alpha-N-acetylglucosaminyl 1-phosphate transferase [Filimonas effusa]